MRTIWIDREGETFPANRRVPDAIVTSFGDLLAVVAEPYARGLLPYIMRTTLDWRPGHFVSADDPTPFANGEPPDDETR